MCPPARCTRRAMSGEPDLCLRCCGRFAAAFIVDHHNLHPEDNHTELGLFTGKLEGKKFPGEATENHYLQVLTFFLKVMTREKLSIQESELVGFVNRQNISLTENVWSVHLACRALHH